MKSLSEESPLSWPESLGRHHIITGPHTVIPLGRCVDPESCSAAIKVTHGGGRCTCRLEGYLSGVCVAGFYFLHTTRLVEFMKENPDSTDVSGRFGGRSWSLSLCCAYVYPS